MKNCERFRDNKDITVNGLTNLMMDTQIVILTTLDFEYYRCKQCNVPICEEKCSKSPNHLLECDTISRSIKANNSDDKTDFNDYNIITPLRFLLMKQKRPKEYATLASLVSNIESKVRKTIMIFNN